MAKKPRTRKSKNTPKTGAPVATPVVEAEPAEEPSFFDDIATILQGGKEAVGAVRQAVTPPPSAEAQPSGLLQAVMGSSIGVVGAVLGGGIDVVQNAFAAQNRQLLQVVRERDQARADAKALLAFYESSAFVEQSVKDRVRAYPNSRP